RREELQARPAARLLPREGREGRDERYLPSQHLLWLAAGRLLARVPPARLLREERSEARRVGSASRLPLGRQHFDDLDRRHGLPPRRPDRERGGRAPALAPGRARREELQARPAARLLPREGREGRDERYLPSQHLLWLAAGRLLARVPPARLLREE